MRGWRRGARAYATTAGQYFKVIKEGHVAQVVLNRPEKLNTMNDGFFVELRRSMRFCDDDPEMRCIVLAAEGRHFSAGLDLKEAAELFTAHSSAWSKAVFAGSLAVGKVAGTAPIPPSEPGMPAMRNQQLLQLIRRWQRGISALQSARLPVIAAVHGKCLGGAVDLVTAADFRFCSRDASFALREVNLAIVADLGTLHRIGRIIGRGLARELALTGRDVDAERALRIGLVNEVYETREALMAGALACAYEVAAHSPLAVQGTKRVMNFADDHPLETGLEHAALWNCAFLKSEDLVHAAAAFLTKSTPQFENHVLPTERDAPGFGATAPSGPPGTP